MSVPFPSAASDASSLIWANALVNGFNERLDISNSHNLGVCYRPLLSEFTSDPLAESRYRDPTDKTNFRMMQEWMECVCRYFVDTYNGPFKPSDWAPEGYILPYTLASWRAAAGLPASGFTRITDSGTQYGFIEAGDYRSLINIEEIQRGLSALDWFYSDAACGDFVNDNYVRSGSGWQYPWADAMTEFITNWSDPYYYHVPCLTPRKQTAARFQWGTSYQISGENLWNKSRIRWLNATSTGVKRAGDLYYFCGSMGNEAPGLDFDVHNPVFDPTGSGLVRGANLVLSIPSTSSTVDISGSIIGDTSFGMPPICAQPTAPDGNTSRGWIVYAAQEIIKPEYTYK